MTPPVSFSDGERRRPLGKGISRVDLATHAITMLAESPVPIGPGGDILNNRIYFATGSHVYSYQVPPNASE